MSDLEILLIAKSGIRSEHVKKWDEIAKLEYKKKDLERDIKKFMDSYPYIIYLNNVKRCKNLDDEIKELEKDAKIIDEKTNAINDKLAKVCEHSFDSFDKVYNQDERQCIKCGWFESDLISKYNIYEGRI